MLDIQFIRDNPDVVKEKSAQKGYDIDVEQLLGFDKKRRELLAQVEVLRRRRNELSENTQGQRPSDEQITEGKALKDQLMDMEHQLSSIEQQFDTLIHTIPNIHADDVPLGGEEASVEIRRYKEQPTGAEDHLDFAVKRGWVDFDRGAKVAGAKFYYLKGDLALLENAITQYALDFVIKKGFTYITVPHMVNNRVATGTGFAPRSTSQSDDYFIEGEDLTLIATAEIPLTGYHADEIMNGSDLPLMYVGYSPCYRKEAGTYGKHSRGLFRVHQFNKLEMYVFTLPENSNAMHEQILQIEEEVWQAIDIPYHIINIASGDLGAPAVKKYDIEYWSKVDGAYRELTSCSNCTDYQTRNLNIRARRENGDIVMLHSLNGTVVSLARSLIAILEHYQTDDGRLRVPEVLKSYMGGRDIL